MNAHSNLLIAQTSNIKWEIGILSFLILFIIIMTLLSLKNGVAYANISIKKENSPIAYWITIVLNIGIIIIFARELYNIFP